MRTVTLNTYNVTFHYTIQVEAAHEDDAPVLAQSDMDHYLQDDDYRARIVRDMAYTVELIDGVEPGQDDDDDTEGVTA